MKNRVLVTGIGWLGFGYESIDSVFQQIINESKQEIIIGVYALSSGAYNAFNALEGALQRGVRIVLVINRLDDQPAIVKQWVNRLRYSSLNCEVFTYQADTDKGDFHAKIVVVDRNKAIIGSSNMSRRGLVSNHELAIYVEGKIADQTAKAVYKLIANKTVLKVTD